MKKQGSRLNEPIAVVGADGIFPKASSARTFIDNIYNKVDSITQVPDNRWLNDPTRFLSNTSRPDKTISDRAGFIHDFDFDADQFRISSDFICSLDRVHRLTLEAGRNAFRQCRCTRDDLAATGVIMASIALPTPATVNYSHDVIFDGASGKATLQDRVRTGILSYPASVLANAMGFGAGTFTLDAACASSLFAIKLACEQLLLKKADIMVAGGVNGSCSLYTQIGFTQLQALSAKGVCAPFDADADGLVVGEGVGIVVLKRLSDAIAAKDTVLALIKGYGVSNDIEGTLVGPASEGQLRAMQQAYRMSGISPADIQYMECHGSGTPVGDNIELNSIYNLLSHAGCSDKKLSIGSVKSMIGHLLTGAGAAGFIKTILAMKEGFLPPSLNYHQAKPDSLLNKSNIHVQTQAEEWTPEKPGLTRKAGVSAFGFGGINAHLIVESFEPDRISYPVSQKSSHRPETLEKCAIIGMGHLSGGIHDLAHLVKTITGDLTVAFSDPGSRFKVNINNISKGHAAAYIDQVTLGAGQFHIPPNQLDEILPQHLALLKTVYEAMADAGIPARAAKNEPLREKYGCAIGIDFDYGATDFHLRWQHPEYDNGLQEKISEGLNFNRTLGALGGIVASRVAREFQFGGPCFTLSNNRLSGISAVETAVKSLSSHETDVFVCGTVDMCGDVRQAIFHQLDADEMVASWFTEGSGAVVLKRYEDAVKDNDRIYAVVDQVNTRSDVHKMDQRRETDALPWADCIQSEFAATRFDSNQFDLIECDVRSVSQFKGVQHSFNARTTPPYFTSAQQIVGSAGMNTSLFSIILSSLCLHLKTGIEYQRQRFSLSGSSQCRAAVFSFSDDAGMGSVFLSDPEKSSENYQGVRDLPVFKNPIHILTNPRPMPQSAAVESGEASPYADKSETNSQCIQDEYQINFDENGPEMNQLLMASQTTASVHEKYLELSAENLALLEKQYNLLVTAASEGMPGQSQSFNPLTVEPWLDYEQCLEYAVGKAGNVLGPDFDIIDTYPVRVRLPAPPLMLVDRIMSVEGKRLGLETGKIVTQHDVKPGAWYLDGPKAPVCISIEAGQADLFLCAYLGIDHVVKGKRKYRLLDAKVTFHRTLPEAFETIEYHIEIDRFLKQGDVYLFFFHYNGFINNELFISMRDGCAGFFTDSEVENSGGIILKPEDKEPVPVPEPFSFPVPVQKEAFNDNAIQALRTGNLESAFGKQFEGLTLARNLWLPDGNMHLIDRVLELDPYGGRFGLGKIIAQSDIHPDDWFLTCHFIDDMVMPGTLMYECCAHALRVFTQRIGWITSDEDAYYDVLIGHESDLKCRGPVTCETRHARYEIEIKYLGYTPEPTVIADAHMFSDDLHIVLYKDMGFKLKGVSLDDIEQLWKNR